VDQYFHFVIVRAEGKAVHGLRGRGAWREHGEQEKGSQVNRDADGQPVEHAREGQQE
jgi:hypothetical protein